MTPPKIPNGRKIDAAAERLAKRAGVSVDQVDKKALRKVFAKPSEGEPPITLP